MTIPTVFETCRPRADVLPCNVTDADFAADMAQVIAGEEYLETPKSASQYELYVRRHGTEDTELDLADTSVSDAERDVGPAHRLAPRPKSGHRRTPRTAPAGEARG